MQENQAKKRTSGNLKISHDVVASIAGCTAAEIEGVDSLAPVTGGSLPGWLFEKRTVRPISISIENGVAIIDIRLNIREGVRIKETSKKVQAAVKEAVQNMTGIVVKSVNLYIAGVVFRDAAGSRG